MDIVKVIEKLEIMDKECDNVQNCFKCRFSNLCDKYCNGMTPKGTIKYLNLLKNLENE